MADNKDCNSNGGTKLPDCAAQLATLNAKHANLDERTKEQIDSHNKLWSRFDDINKANQITAVSLAEINVSLSYIKTAIKELDRLPAIEEQVRKTNGTNLRHTSEITQLQENVASFDDMKQSVRVWNKGATFLIAALTSVVTALLVKLVSMINFSM